VRQALVDTLGTECAPVWKDLHAKAMRRPDAGALAMFTPQIGQSYDGEFMVIGRCTNEWAPLPEFGSLADALPAGDGTTQVERNWAAPKGCYPFCRSNFWQVTRVVANRLQGAETDAPGWASRIAWSNLYKLAPLAAREGSVATTDLELQRFQFEEASVLLAAELRILRPKCALLLTGWEMWADRFARHLSWETTPVADAGWILASGTLGHGIRVVIAAHPQAKPNRRATAERIVALFKELGGTR